MVVMQVNMLLSSSDLKAELVKPLEPLSLDKSSADPEIDLTDIDMTLASFPLLGPDETYAYAFYVSCANGAGHLSSSEAVRCLMRVDTIGVVEVHWSATMGENARARSEEIKVGHKVPFPLASIPSQVVAKKGGESTVVVGTPQSLGSGLSNEDRKSALIVTAISYPERAVVGQSCKVTVRVSNYFTYPIISQLQSRSDHQDGGLAVVGLSFHNLGALDADDSIDVDLSILPLNGGMHMLSGLVAVDLTTKNEFPAYSLCQIMVYDDLLPQSQATSSD
jgi:hypothetical protein